MEPMKSLRVVLSQSHTSTERRRSLSDGFNLLHTNTHEKTHLKCRESVCLTLTDSQDKGLVPGGVERGADGPGLLFGLILGVWDEFELHIRVWQTIGVHGNQISGLTHWVNEKEIKKWSTALFKANVLIILILLLFITEIMHHLFTNRFWETCGHRQRKCYHLSYIPHFLSKFLTSVLLNDSLRATKKLKWHLTLLQKMGRLHFY